ncbi:HNH endonuclease family protein [Streptomyces sp. NBC_01142]|uniref:HNH endonuclease family protein n=1 Tax=Streptomyces sp. NBC_01142 TaxID=2975865 RepID=UPI00225240D1|nr:HNH endonuclease family protein [Streptomyces sp. NBC_01142]MCX4826560.1 HNH endonuclease family protein [Streptomyces sp. NBC_01142]
MNVTTRRAALAGVALAATLTGCSALADQPGSDNAKAAAQGPAAAGTAQRALARLTVKGPAPMTGYDREAKFGPAWSDTTTAPGSGNSCDTRNDVLRRDLHKITFKGTSRCVIATGTLEDPYTGKRINFVRGPQSAKVQIDHAVALGASWRTGAAQLTQEQRRAVGNDPLNLISADGPANSAKSDADAATWLPPNKTFRCSYVARQIAVKAKYHLWVTPPEKTAMTRVLAGCPNQVLPTDASTGVALPGQK